MDHYLDIALRADPEFPQALLMGALFGKLHRALVALQASDIGVSFPRHGLTPRTLGDRLRLHGNAPALERLMAQPWLRGMYDHAQIGSMGAIPANADHCVVRRRQFKTSAERLRRRRAKRHAESAEQARAHIPDSIERRVTLPFVTLRSQSTGQRFDLFIEHGPPQAQPIDGMFNAYGLSQGATIPWF